MSRYDAKGTLVFFSDLEKGGPGRSPKTYGTHDEAKTADDRLLAEEGVLADALTTSEKPPRPRRVPTPFGYSKKTAKPTAKIRHQDQSPHTVAFASIEQRLQNRLRKGQQSELAEQIPSVEDAKAGMQAEHGLAEGSKQLTRYVTDFTSLRNEFDHRLANDAEKGVGSAFHLVARKLLNIHPYAAYHGGKSARQQEDKDELFGSSVLDTSHRMSSAKGLESYFQTREDLYHSSDDEESGYKGKSKSEPYEYASIPKRAKKFTRAARERRAKALAAGTGSASEMELDQTKSDTNSAGKRKLSSLLESDAKASESTAGAGGESLEPTKKLKGEVGQPVNLLDGPSTTSDEGL